MFIISLEYIKDLSEADAYMEAHMAYVEKYYAQGNFLASGRKIPRTGGVIFAKADSRKDIDAIVAEDPFYSAGIAKYDVTEIAPSRAVEGLKGILD